MAASTPASPAKASSVQTSVQTKGERTRAAILDEALRLVSKAGLDGLTIGTLADATESAELPGGCPMIGGAAEFDDRPGPVRDMLAGGQRTWIETLKRAVRQAIEERQLAADTDPEQIAFEMFGIALVVHH